MTEQTPKRSMLGARMTAALQATRQLAGAHNRPDLAGRLAESQKRIDDPSLCVLVVGEFKQGKSTLVNALVGQEVCPVDDDIATAVPTVLRHGPAPTAHVIYQQPDSRGPDATPGEQVREPVDVASVADFVTETAGAPSDRRIHSVEVALPAEVLESGLVLIDTPGVGGLGSIHSTVTLGALPSAEAVIFVSDASQEFTAPEIEFMEAARSMCPNIVVLLTKIDFYPAWRKVQALDEGHLRELGIDAEILPVSSTLHTIAKDAGDADLEMESGFPAMQEHLTSHIVGRAEHLSALKLASDLNGVLDQLQGALQTHRAALRDPEAAKAKQVEFRAAKQRAEELRSRAARWQQTLQDGTADLNAEVDHDLRARFRKINEQVDGVLEDMDPKTGWDEFELWLYQRVAEDVVHNYRFLQHQAKLLAERVAEHFEIDRATLDLVDVEVTDPTAGLRQTTVRAELNVAAESKLDNRVGVARGGMMGSILFSVPFGLVTGPLGLAAMTTAIASLVFVPPIMIGFGYKAHKDNKNRALTQARALARTTQRKYMDEAQFAANKDSRAAVRLTQRQLRDFFTTRAAEQSRTVDENLAALNAALQADQKTHKQQVEKVEADVKALTKVRNQVQLIVPKTAA